MGFDSIWHWGLLLIIVLLVFGTKKIRNLGPDLGAAIRDFKKSLSGDDEAKQKEEAEVKRKTAEQLRGDPPSTGGADSSTDANAKQSQRDSSETK